MKVKPFTPKKLKSRVFSQLWMLALQFVLGMALNLIGTDTTGPSHTLYTVILVTHILNAIGLVEGSIYILIKEKDKLSIYIVTALCITLSAGILTVFTRQDIWSFAMACGFILSSWLTVLQYIQADRKLTLSIN